MAHEQPVKFWQIIGADGRTKAPRYDRYSEAIGIANLLDERPITVQGFDKHDKAVLGACCTYVGSASAKGDGS